jgi:hypothetical protein
MSSLNTNSSHGAITAVSLHHFLAVILIVAPLGAILLLIISTLLFFTPPKSRKRPVFILNILACLLGICQAIYFACLNSYVILHPDASGKTQNSFRSLYKLVQAIKACKLQDQQAMSIFLQVQFNFSLTSSGKSTR